MADLQKMKVSDNLEERANRGCNPRCHRSWLISHHSASSHRNPPGCHRRPPDVDRAPHDGSPSSTPYNSPASDTSPSLNILEYPLVNILEKTSHEMMARSWNTLT